MLSLSNLSFPPYRGEKPSFTGVLDALNELVCESSLRSHLDDYYAVPSSMLRRAEKEKPLSLRNVAKLMKLPEQLQNSYV